MYSFNFSFKNVVENMGDSLIVLYLGWLILSNKGGCMQNLQKRWLTLRKSFFHYFYLSGLCCDDCCCCCWWPPRPRPRPRWPPLPPTSSLIVYSGGWWQRKCRRVSMDCRKRCFHKLLALDSCHQGRGACCCWSLCCCCASTSEAAASSSPQLSRRPSLCQSWEVELQDQKHVVLSL